MSNHAGVGCLTGGASNITVPVPHRPAGIETNTMHHASSDKPVIPAPAWIIIRVGTIADKTTGKFAWNDSCDIERSNRRLGENRRKVTLKIAIGRIRRTTRQPEAGDR